MKTLDVTQGINGYPKDTFTALAFDTMPDLLNYAANNEGKIVLLKRREGWHFFENKGTFYGKSLLDIPVNDADFCLVTSPATVSDDAFRHITGCDTVQQAVHEMYPPENEIDPVINQLNQWQERINDIIGQVSEPCRIHFRTDDTNYIDYILNQSQTSFHEDVWTYQLAFIPEYGQG